MRTNEFCYFHSLIANLEPVIYTNSEYGLGKTPIVYYNIQCQGWEKSIIKLTTCTSHDELIYEMD